MLYHKKSLYVGHRSYSPLQHDIYSTKFYELAPPPVIPDSITTEAGDSITTEDGVLITTQG